MGADRAGRDQDPTWPVVRDLVDEVVPVGEGAVVEAMRLCYEVRPTVYPLLSM